MASESVVQSGSVRERFEPVAMVLAIILPGAGHVFLREGRRGLLVAFGVLGLYVGGVLIGGISVVDSREQRIWYFGQLLAGPITLGVDSLHQGMKVETPPGSGVFAPPPPGGGASYEPSLGKMREIGTLYCAVAGMMNLIAILDVTFHRGRRDLGEEEGS